MGSLREVKNRINSVKNTRKITSAMRLVASSKLTRVEGIITNMIPYQQKLDDIVAKLLSGEVTIDSPFLEAREVKRVAVVVVSSNTTLCGAFNSNVSKGVNALIDNYSWLDENAFLFYPIGKKIEEVLKKRGFDIAGSFQELAEMPTYNASKEIAYELMAKFIKGEIDKVVLLYHHFKSLGSQELVEELFLPFDIENYRSKSTNSEKDSYIIEPTEADLLEELLPKVLSQKLFTVLVDSNASEHAARSLAMQLATDNANELIDDLTLQYNKSRQQAITSELLDIVGGSMR